MKLSGKVSGWAIVKGGILKVVLWHLCYFLSMLMQWPSIVEFSKLLQFACDTTLMCSGPDVDTVTGPEEGKLKWSGHCKCIIKGEERITAQCAKHTLRSAKQEHWSGGRPPWKIL